MGLNAIQEHLDRVYGKEAAKAYETENYFVYDVRYCLKDHPLVSVIIPTKDNAPLLEKRGTEHPAVYPSMTNMRLSYWIITQRSRDLCIFKRYTEKNFEMLRVLTSCI